MNSRPEAVPEGASARLVATIAGAGETADLTVRSFGALPGHLFARPLDERRITADQTNVSVVVGERVMVKWMRPQTGARAPDLLAHLASNRFTRTPTPYAAVFRGAALVAMVTAYLPEATDGWQWCVDAVLGQFGGGPAADFAAHLGALAAELHAALATPSPVIASPVRRAPAPTDGAAVLDEARRCALAAGDDDGHWFAERVPAMAAEILAGAEPALGGDPVAMIQAHGDLHVGQILRWRDGYAVTDFDGNPTGTSTWEPAARDVAQLRTSLLHVAQIANRRTSGRYRDALLDWGRASAEELLVGYRAGLAERGLAHLLDERLLRPYEVAQECRELIYAARFLPRWRYAPMGVLRSWYD